MTKKHSTFRSRVPAVIIAAVLLLGGNLSLLNSQSGSSGGLSRSMEQAIRLYHDGDDNEAMDRFMDILVKGTPAEKSLANDYISKITMRMNTGIQTNNDQSTEEGAMKEVETTGQVYSTKQQDEREQAQAPSGEYDSSRDESQARSENVTDKINQRIAGMRRQVLLELGKSPAVKIYMGDSLPRAVTINPRYFFSNATAFTANSAATLSNLSGLIFTLGKANVLILPEGTVGGDVKIKSIRQAIALNSYFISRGISKSRLDINLTGSEIKFPRELTDISGIIILFDYDKTPKLTASEDVRSRGPGVSLGIYPTAISVRKNEGALVEFSVLESAAGKPSWKFEIFSVQSGNLLVPLQKMEGYGPQYNQSYWNGRKNFFGAPYAAGKYMFSVTATDSEGTEKNLRRLLIVKPNPEDVKAVPVRKPVVKSAAASKKTAAAARSSKGKGLFSKNNKAALKGGKTGIKAGTRAKGKSAAPVKKKIVKATTPVSSAVADTASDSQTVLAQVSYKIFFREQTASVTPNSEKKIAQVAETMGYYPMARVKLIGYAYSGEPGAEDMAQKRVTYVSTRLISKYKIEKERMDISTQISDAPSSIVEIKMLGKE